MRSRVLAAAFAAAVTVGCSGEAVVLAQLEDPDTGDTTPLTQLEIRYLPYDRDVVFDSLQNVASRPEPAAPDSLIELQAAIAEAQVTWSTATERWNSARDSLRSLSARLDRLPRASPEYRLLYRDFQPQEAAEAAAQRQMDASFSRYDDLQRRYTAQAQEYSLLLDQWGDEAFADVDDVIAARVEAAGREEVFDTTDMNGIARTSLPKGQWWVYARYELIYDELYWNVPLEVTGGEPTELVLNRANAQRRPRY
ncbi:MAG TPA: hypothetical protein VMM79_05685 [Longimicrobiales bacterium]|nr:hypothetical protein [Longimicrobiales bacterium]